VPEPPKAPEKKVFGLKQRKKKTENELEREAWILKKWNEYLRMRHDMSTVGFAWGPDFRKVRNPISCSLMTL